jgi:hypothetical protein
MRTGSPAGAPSGFTGRVHSADSMMNAIDRPSGDQTGPAFPRSAIDACAAGW